MGSGWNKLSSLDILDNVINAHLNSKDRFTDHSRTDKTINALLLTDRMMNEVARRLLCSRKSRRVARMPIHYLWQASLRTQKTKANLANIRKYLVKGCEAWQTRVDCTIEISSACYKFLIEQCKDPELVGLWMRTLPSEYITISFAPINGDDIYAGPNGMDFSSLAKADSLLFLFFKAIDQHWKGGLAFNLHEVPGRSSGSQTMVFPLTQFRVHFHDDVFSVRNQSALFHQFGMLNNEQQFENAIRQAKAQDIAKATRESSQLLRNVSGWMHPETRVFTICRWWCKWYFGDQFIDWAIRNTILHLKDKAIEQFTVEYTCDLADVNEIENNFKHKDFEWIKSQIEDPKTLFWRSIKIFKVVYLFKFWDQDQKPIKRIQKTNRSQVVLEFVSKLAVDAA